MAKKDGFPQDDRIPEFLSEHADEYGQPGIGKLDDRAVIQSRILKTSIWVVTATAFGLAVLSLGNPVALLADVAALLVDKSAIKSGADQPVFTIHSTGGTRDWSPQESSTPTQGAFAATFAPFNQKQTEISEISQPPVEPLLKQFTAWAAAEDIRAQAGPAHSVQDFPIQAAQDAATQVRPVQKSRRLRSVQNARAEMRPKRDSRAKVRREAQNAQTQVSPVPAERTQDEPVQNAQETWLPQSDGWRN